VYQFLCQASIDKVLISPRELQTMALLTLNYQRQHPKADPLATAKHYAYSMGVDLLPSSLREHFLAKFPIRALYHEPPLESKDLSDFLICRNRMKMSP
jgi:hypothetical protein